MAIKKRPVSPRQKMINLMYVVLMAMLALNISTEVLDGFTIVEESLNRTTANSSKENVAMLADLDEQMKESPEKTDELLETFIDIQMEVNKRRVLTIRHTLEKMKTAVSQLTEIDASTRYELMQRLQGMKRHTKLCHGDFVPSNVILRNDGTWCVLDWAHASQGNAGADAATTYMRFSLEDPEMAERYLKMYCRKADMAVQYIQQWMPIVAAAQLLKGVEGEEKLLREWISVAEYQ